MVAGTSLGDDE